MYVLSWLQCYVCIVVVVEVIRNSEGCFATSFDDFVVPFHQTNPNERMPRLWKGTGQVARHVGISWNPKSPSGVEILIVLSLSGLGSQDLTTGVDRSHLLRALLVMNQTRPNV